MPNPGMDSGEKYSTDAWRVWGRGRGGGGAQLGLADALYMYKM